MYDVLEYLAGGMTETQMLAPPKVVWLSVGNAGTNAIGDLLERSVERVATFPVKDSAKKSARVIRVAKEIYYPGAPHGLTATHQDQVKPTSGASVRQTRLGKVPRSAHGFAHAR